MLTLASLTTHLRAMLPARRAKIPPIPLGSSRQDRDFREMTLVSYRQHCDLRGRWWTTEVRRDRFTGLIVQRTKRITD